MNTWKLRFERYLVDDPVAFRMLERLVRKGFPRHQVLNALGNFTDPGVGRRLRNVFEEFAPVKKRTAQLSGQCLKLRQGIRNIYGSPFGVWFPEATGMLHLADVLEKAAVQLKRADYTMVLSGFTEKSLWNGFALALLYEELNIPRSLSWDNWHPLYRVARQAHGLSDDLIGPKSLGTNHRRFLKRNPRIVSVLRFLAKSHTQLFTATPKRPI
jgi:hypothetical protein